MVTNKPPYGVLYLVLFVLAMTPMVFGVDVGYVVGDSFHEGEYLGAVWHIFHYYKGEAGFPLFIHGAMDFIPSVLAKNIYGEEKIIVGTRIINSVIVLVSWVLLLDISRRIASRSWIGYAISLLPLLMLFLASKNYQQAINLHHAIVGPRDFFLILAIWSLAGYSFASNRINRLLFGSMALCASIFAIFWSYDRGVIAGLIIIAISMLTWRNDKRSVWLVISVLIGCFLFIEVTGFFGGILDNFRNILYWLKYSQEVWSNKDLYPITVQPLLLPVAGILLVPLACIGVHADKKLKDTRALAIVFLLFVVEIFLVKSIFNRPGLPRTSWGLWPLVLILVYALSRLPISYKRKAGDSNNERHFDFQFISTVAPLFVLTLAFSNYFYAYPNVNNVHKFLSALKNPPSDRLLIDSDLLKASIAVGKNARSCAFLWSNEGIISLIAKLPVCSGFYYPVYAASVYEDKIIADLRNETPEVIVVESPFWSIKIDNKTMRNRFPSIWKFIESHYPYEEKVGAYTLRSVRPSITWLFSGDRLTFDNLGDAQIFLGSGWSQPESWGVWSDGGDSKINLDIPVNKLRNWKKLRLFVKGYVVPGMLPSQIVKVFFNNKKIGDIKFSDESVRDVMLNLPDFDKSGDISENIKSEISFKISNPVSPNDLKLSGDSRRLGLGLVSIQFLVD